MPQHTSTLRRAGLIAAGLIVALTFAILEVTPAAAADPGVRWSPSVAAVPFCTEQAGRPRAITAATFQRTVEDAVTTWNVAGAQVHASYAGNCGPDAPGAASKAVRIEFDGNAQGAVGSEAAQTMLVFGAPPAGHIIEARIRVDEVAATMAPACLAHIVIHEIGHALGLDHRTDPADIMHATFDPQHSANCKTSPSPSEYAAIRALYGTASNAMIPAPPLVDLAAAGAPVGAGRTGRLLSTPTFDRSGIALAVFDAGSLAQIETSARAAGASAVWAQNASGQFHALVIDAPAFVNAGFHSAFGGGFATSTSGTLTRPR